MALFKRIWAIRITYVCGLTFQMETGFTWFGAQWQRLRLMRDPRRPTQSPVMVELTE